MSKRKSFSDKVFVSLKNKIARLDRLKVVNHLVNDTECGFTRNRKLPFPDVIMIILSMAGCPIREELLDYFDYDINTATSSAFVQAGAKVLPEAFEQLLHLFNNAYPCTETYKGYRLSPLTVPISIFLMIRRTGPLFIKTNIRPAVCIISTPPMTF